LLSVFLRHTTCYQFFSSPKASIFCFSIRKELRTRTLVITDLRGTGLSQSGALMAFWVKSTGILQKQDHEPLTLLFMALKRRTKPFRQNQTLLSIPVISIKKQSVI